MPTANPAGNGPTEIVSLTTPAGTVPHPVPLLSASDAGGKVTTLTSTPGVLATFRTGTHDGPPGFGVGMPHPTVSALSGGTVTI